MHSGEDLCRALHLHPKTYAAGSAQEALHFEEDRQNDRAALGRFVNETAQRISNLRLHRVPVRNIFILTALQRLNRHLTRLIHQLFVFSDIDKASGDDVRSGDHQMTFALDSRHDDHQPGLGQQFAISEYDIADITDTETIDENRVGLHLVFFDKRLARIDVQNVAVVEYEDVLLLHAQRLCQSGVLHQIPA